MKQDVKLANWYQYIDVILQIQNIEGTIRRLIQIKTTHMESITTMQNAQTSLADQLYRKSEELSALKTKAKELEEEHETIKENIKSLSKYQETVKKASEYNAVYQKIVSAQKTKQQHESLISEIIDRKIMLEDDLSTIKNSVLTSEEHNYQHIQDLILAIKKINHEALELLTIRNALMQDAPESILEQYRKLAPIRGHTSIIPLEIDENDIASCGGCHLVIPQHKDNQLRKQTECVRCEHCARIFHPPTTHSGIKSAAWAKKRRSKKPT